MGRKKNNPGLVNEIMNHLQNGDPELFGENYWNLSSDDRKTIDVVMDQMAADEYGDDDPYEAEEDERPHYDSNWD